MNTRRSKIILSIVNLGDFPGMVAINGLATTPAVNNKTVGEVLEQCPTLSVPDRNMMPC